LRAVLPVTIIEKVRNNKGFVSNPNFHLNVKKGPVPTGNMTELSWFIKSVFIFLLYAMFV